MPVESQLLSLRIPYLAAPLFLIGVLAGCASLPGGRTIDGAAGAIEISRLPGSEPTIVFEAGLGAYKETWDAVFKDLGGANAVFAYNRPGVGRSKATDAPRDGRTIIENLRELLRRENVKPPFVLVGHSAGGLYMQLYARLYPSEVAGIVLVDPTHPLQFEGEGGLERRGAASVAAMSVAGLFGPIRAEFDALTETGREVLAAPPLSGGIPAIVLVAPDRSTGAMSAFDNAKRQDYRRLYPSADFREIDGGHNIPAENPQAVVDAIRDVLLRASRGRSGLSSAR
jgi:pimeloyl-ACP methyl ester carboxylesterase